MKLSTKIKKYGCWLCSDNDTIMETIVIKVKADFTEYKTHSLSIADRIERTLKTENTTFSWNLEKE